MIRHASIQAMLARRDRLDGEEEARLAAHIEQCPECRQRARDYTEQVAFLRSFRREAAPPGLREGLLALVDQQGQPASHARGESRGRIERWAWRARPHVPTRSVLRWPGIVLAAVLAIVLPVFSPIVGQRSTSPVNAQAEQLLRFAASTTPSMPYSGAAMVSYLGPETNLLPDPVVTHRFIIRWSASDAQHFREEVQTVEPALDSGTLTTIQDGSTGTQYDTRTETAGIRAGAGFDGMFGLVGSAPPVSVIAPDQSIQQYLDETQQDLASSVRHFARILPQTRLLDREVDVVQFAPVERGIRCVPKGANGMDCNSAFEFGMATVWIDDTTHLILKYRADFTDSPHPFVRSSLYEVTSLRLGQGATQADLSQQPPVAVQPVAAHPPTGTTMTGGPPGAAPPVPHGFLSASPPAELPNAYTDMETLTTPPLGDATGLNLLFIPSDGHHFSPYVPGERFLSIEERVRAHGLPSELETGTPVQAGACRAWAGEPATSLHTLAFARGAISVLIESNNLSEADLVSYVAHGMCQ